MKMNYLFYILQLINELLINSKPLLVKLKRKSALNLELIIGFHVHTLMNLLLKKNNYF